jgi:hypothetical protein
MRIYLMNILLILNYILTEEMVLRNLKWRSDDWIAVITSKCNEEQMHCTVLSMGKWGDI